MSKTNQSAASSNRACRAFNIKGLTAIPLSLFHFRVDQAIGKLAFISKFMRRYLT